MSRSLRDSPIVVWDSFSGATCRLWVHGRERRDRTAEPTVLLQSPDTGPGDQQSGGTGDQLRRVGGEDSGWNGEDSFEAKCNCIIVGEDGEDFLKKFCVVC